MDLLYKSPRVKRGLEESWCHVVVANVTKSLLELVFVHFLFQCYQVWLALLWRNQLGECFFFPLKNKGDYNVSMCLGEMVMSILLRM